MGLVSLLTANPIAFFVVAGTLVLCITIHEWAHAIAADKLGDPTPRHQGRVTLNPLAHLDPIGTLAILLIGFGWGRPVPYDPYNLESPKRDAALIALAGPASNIILALMLAVITPLLAAQFSSAAIAITGVSSLIQLYNIMLALFNLIPVYPLDGSKIIVALLPESTAYEYESFMNRYGMLVLFALIFPWSGSSAVSALLLPAMNTVLQLMESLSQAIASLL